MINGYLDDAELDGLAKGLVEVLEPLDRRLAVLILLHPPSSQSPGFVTPFATPKEGVTTPLQGDRDSLTREEGRNPLRF